MYRLPDAYRVVVAAIDPLLVKRPMTPATAKEMRLNAKLRKKREILKTDKEMRANPGFGITIHIRRQAFGYSQRELARLVGVKASHIAYLENGRRLPSLGLLVRLAKELNVRPGKLALQAFPILTDFGVK